MLLSFTKPWLDSIDWILRKGAILNYILMKIVSEKVCTLASTMTIIYGKVGTSWPFTITQMAFAIRFENVQDYGYSVFVIVSDESLVCVRCIRSYQSVSLQWMLCWFMVWDNNFVSRLQRKLLLVWRLVAGWTNWSWLLVFLIFLHIVACPKDVSFLSVVSSWTALEFGNLDCLIHCSWVFGRQRLLLMTDPIVNS